MLTPGAPGRNLVPEPARPRRAAPALAALADAAMAGADPGLGLVLRTAAGDAAEPEIARRDRRAAAPTGRPSRPPTARRAWLRPAPGAAAEALRDWRLPGDSLREAPSALADAGVWEEVAALALPLVPLGQGSMSVEATRALVAVDVNTGGDLSPAAALKVNLAAAAELPRQLRLRGLGGQVTIDFAPLARADRPRVERALATALAADGIETTVAGWTPLGHLELQRRRARRPLVDPGGAG